MSTRKRRPFPYRDPQHHYTPAERRAAEEKVRAFEEARAKKPRLGANPAYVQPVKRPARRKR